MLLPPQADGYHGTRRRRCAQRRSASWCGQRLEGSLRHGRRPRRRGDVRRLGGWDVRALPMASTTRDPVRPSLSTGVGGKRGTAQPNPGSPCFRRELQRVHACHRRVPAGVDPFPGEAGLGAEAEQGEFGEVVGEVSRTDRVSLLDLAQVFHHCQADELYEPLALGPEVVCPFTIRNTRIGGAAARRASDVARWLCYAVPSRSSPMGLPISSSLSTRCSPK